MADGNRNLFRTTKALLIMTVAHVASVHDCQCQRPSWYELIAKCIPSEVLILYPFLKSKFYKSLARDLDADQWLRALAALSLSMTNRVFVIFRKTWAVSRKRAIMRSFEDPSGRVSFFFFEEGGTRSIFHVCQDLDIYTFRLYDVVIANVEPY